MEGTFYGQCSELCGVNHGFMPIQAVVVSNDSFFNEMVFTMAKKTEGESFSKMMDTQKNFLGVTVDKSEEKLQAMLDSFITDITPPEGTDTGPLICEVPTKPIIKNIYAREHIELMKP
jgi:hypothetical protein